MKTQRIWKSFTRSLGLGLTLGLLGAFTQHAIGETVYAVSDSLGELLTFDSSNPGELTSAYTITGLQSGEQIRGIDFVNGTLYGLGNASHLYTIDANNGAATMVGSGLGITLNGIDFGFNAGPSQLYVSSDLGQNLTINPVTGLATAGPAYTAGSSLDSMAYNYASGVFYGISSSSHNLFTINPVTGSVTLVGPTGINFADRIGFDISPNSGQAYFVAAVGGQDQFFTINLATGAATLVGDLDAPGELTAGIDGLAVVPEPGLLTLLAVGGGLLFARFRLKK